MAVLIPARRTSPGDTKRSKMPARFITVGGKGYKFDSDYRCSVTAGGRISYLKRIGYIVVTRRNNSLDRHILLYVRAKGG